MKLFNKASNKTSQEGVSAPSIFAVEDSRMIYTVSITDNISDVFIYDEVLMLLENAEENDEIIFNIASYGGRLDSLLALRSGILSTKATVIGKLVSHACSAGGMLLLCCHNKIVYPNTTFHAHTASYGSYGKSADIKTQVDFETRQIEKLVHDIYEGFLDAENEIPLLLDGKEFYFDAEETIKRIENQTMMRDAQQSQAEQDMLDSIEQETLEHLSDDDLQDELDELADVIKELKKEQAKRKGVNKKSNSTPEK